MLAVHGGNTVHTVAYSCRPAVFIPTQFEQQYNLEFLFRHYVELIVSRKFFREKHLLRAIRSIFSNYDEYLARAEFLAKLLSKGGGEVRDVLRLVEIDKGLLSRLWI